MVKHSLAGYDDGETINSILRYHDDNVTTDYKLREEGHRLLTNDFLRLVLLAIAIASPFTWYTMDRWLSDFAYRIDIPWWAFGVAGSLAITIAFLTVSLQSIKSALMNPVKSLRSE